MFGDLVVEGYTLLESPPLSLPAQQTECYKSNSQIGLSYSFLQCRLKIALGGSDLDSDYSLFPKICLAVVTITYCSLSPISQCKAFFPKSAVLLLGYSEGH